MCRLGCRANVSSLQQKGREEFGPSPRPPTAETGCFSSTSPLTRAIHTRLVEMPEWRNRLQDMMRTLVQGFLLSFSWEHVSLSPSAQHICCSRAGWLVEAAAVGAPEQNFSLLHQTYILLQCLGACLNHPCVCFGISTHQRCTFLHQLLGVCVFICQAPLRSSRRSVFLSTDGKWLGIR